MRRLLALIGVWPLVWTQDHDGEVRLRVAKKTPFACGWSCGSICFWDRSVQLLPDGSTTGRIYVKRWAEWEHNRKHVTFEVAEK